MSNWFFVLFCFGVVFSIAKGVKHYISLCIISVSIALCFSSSCLLFSAIRSVAESRLRACAPTNPALTRLATWLCKKSSMGLGETRKVKRELRKGKMCSGVFEDDEAQARNACKRKTEEWGKISKQRKASQHPPETVSSIFAAWQACSFTAMRIKAGGDTANTQWISAISLSS